MKAEESAVTSCAQIRGLLDDFLASETPSQVSLQIDAHIESCASCSDELRFRQSARGLLRRSVESEKASPELRGRILKNLKEPRRRVWGPSLGWLWALGTVGSFAAVAIVTLASLRWHANRIYDDPAAQAAYIQKISEGIPSIQKIGLADHIHCAFLRRYPQEYPKQAIAAQQLGPELVALANHVKEKLSVDYQVVLAHRCSYAGRHYIHFVMRSDSHLMSIVLTEKGPSESFTGLSLARAGESQIFQATASQFQVSGFESGSYLAYIISDLDQASSVEIAEKIAPVVASTIRTMKS